MRLPSTNSVIKQFALACKHFLGEEGGTAWLAQMGQMLQHPKMGGQMLRIAVKPEWVNVMDFQQRFPSAVEAVMGS